MRAPPTVARLETPDVVPTTHLAVDCSRRGGHAFKCHPSKNAAPTKRRRTGGLTGPDESTMACWSASVRLVRALANSALYLVAGISAIMHCVIGPVDVAVNSMCQSRSVSCRNRRTQAVTL